MSRIIYTCYSHWRSSRIHSHPHARTRASGAQLLAVLLAMALRAAQAVAQEPPDGWRRRGDRGEDGALTLLLQRWPGCAQIGRLLV